MIGKVIYCGPRGSSGQGQSHKVIFAINPEMYPSHNVLCLLALAVRANASLYPFLSLTESTVPG